MATDDCPSMLYRVVADIGFGWPVRTRQERKRRTFTSSKDAARWIGAIRALPSHHGLVAVYMTDAQWQPVNLDEEVAALAAQHAAADDGYED